MRVTCNWKRLMGKFYYCGISTFWRQIKNPRTSHERKFNLLLCDVLLFCSFDFHKWYHNNKIEGLSNINVLYRIHIYMLKISCKLSIFWPIWSFRAKVPPPMGSKNVLPYYSYCTIFLKQLKTMMNKNKKTNSTTEKKLEVSAENRRWASETVGKIETQLFMRGWGKITVQKTN